MKASDPSGSQSLLRRRHATLAEERAASIVLVDDGNLSGVLVIPFVRLRFQLPVPPNADLVRGKAGHRPASLGIGGALAGVPVRPLHDAISDLGTSALHEILSLLQGRKRALDPARDREAEANRHVRSGLAGGSGAHVPKASHHFHAALLACQRFSKCIRRLPQRQHVVRELAKVPREKAEHVLAGSGGFRREDLLILKADAAQHENLRGRPSSSANELDGLAVAVDRIQQREDVGEA
eukprot:scaffold613_cov243-Pinguiococcus_pyrenoidosus.AAC.41